MISGSLGLRQYFPQDIKIVFSERIESPPPRFICRHRIILHPCSAGVLIEIHARVSSLVDRIHVEARYFLGKARRALSREQSRKNEQHRTNAEKPSHGRLPNVSYVWPPAHSLTVPPNLNRTSEPGGQFSQTQRPPTMVRSIGILMMLYGSSLKTSRPSTTRSANLPASIEPFTFSS